ncbi:3'(2'),5'-bisphosphate nucleotidase CysQ [Adhaeribacter aquaticus]|uniref:3'(2'),5'-bisphosphate nucleotidase CysQ n=1 Tax=Adhaeribacter aquaticus TaxID=299567 RepID=UPI0004258DBC|nr:3'(2'),5'-bisphosphate nucleotidase CysQ [Adhaeribacter aquaticus]
MLSQINIEQLLKIALEAGEAILTVYNHPEEALQVKLKTDESPLTLADEASHKVIEIGLQKLTPEIPILSEEGASIAYEERKNWEYFWCVDPLDGTKEFIKRNGEFTVNIALIHNERPVLGVIYVPVQQTLYWGGENIGSFKRTPDGTTIQLQVNAEATEWVSVGSRSHASPEEEIVLAQYPIVSSITAGSSLKFCLIAEGKAHIYYRQGPTMEWDTASGQAIVANSGGVMTMPNGEPFRYNKPSLLNGGFLCKVR